MFLQHPSSHSFSSTTLSYSYPCLSKPSNFTTIQTHPVNLPARANNTIKCSQSRNNYGTMDYNRRPVVKWNDVFRKLSVKEMKSGNSDELGGSGGVKGVLNQVEREGRSLSKWVLSRVAKELRKFSRHQQALEVYEWMNSKGKFVLSTSDAAVQLDLIAKVRGLSSGEDFFEKLPDKLKDKRIYGALLNCYARARMREKAESILDKMKERGYIEHALPFNVMMTLYMKLHEYERVELMVLEMMEKNIKLDIYTYNIWLSARGSQLSAEKMEEVFEKMKLDRSVIPNWTTFSTMATMYIKMNMFEKAEECLRRVESRITGRDRIPYHYLLTLYGSIGKREDIYRVWKIYKAVYPSILNLGYHAMLAALLKVNDIEGAETIYEEWLPTKSFFDPRIVNLLMNWYVRDGQLDKAEGLYEQMVEMGGKPNSTTWEILVEGHIRDKRIKEALSCWEEAFSAEESKSWRPKFLNVASFCSLCDEEADAASKEVLTELLRQSSFLKYEAYAALVCPSNGTLTCNNNSLEANDQVDSGHDGDYYEDGSEMLFK